MQRLRLDLCYDLPAPAAQVWPALADTERLNRQVGLPPTMAEAVGGEPIREARVNARMFGIPVEWTEQPFDFVENRFFFVRRKLTGGPIREFNGGLSFEPHEGGTRVMVASEFLPANAAGAAAVRMLFFKTRLDFDRLIAHLRANLAGEQPTPYGDGVDLAPAASRTATMQRLRAADPEFAGEPIADRLLNHLASAGDIQLVRIRPFALAQKWGATRYEALRTCLRAARLGLIDLSWDLLCPNCGGAKNRWPRLEEVRDRSHCDDCQISFDANFDRAVEVTFRPNPRFRAIDGLIYCSGGPRNTPHLAAQKVLAPGERWEGELELTPGRYRLRNLTAELASPLFVTEEGAAVPNLHAVFEADHLEVRESVEAVRPGPIRLVLENCTETRQRAILERLGGYEDIATAADVTVFQEFRDLFGKEVLSPATQLGIQTLPLLFTDLKGSTALYDRLGDASAYALVRDHFVLLRETVGRHGGGVVKTIGDAVMAAFPTPAAAVACALEIHVDVAQFNATAREPLQIGRAHV